MRLLALLKQVSHALDTDSVAVYYQPIFAILLAALGYRASHATAPAAEVTAVEQATVQAFVTLVTKLNELQFKPLLLKTMAWMQDDSDLSRSDSRLRTVSFYVLVDALAGVMRSIFVPYYGYFLEDMVTRIREMVQVSGFLVPAGNGHTTTAEKRKKKRSREQQPTGETAVPAGDSEYDLLHALLSALHRCFLYDADGFVTPERFEFILPALIAQLQHPSVHDSLVIQTLAQLAVCVNDETQWKPLNHQVLLQTRHDEPQVRINALLVIKELYIRLGEELLILVAESVRGWLVVDGVVGEEEGGGICSCDEQS